MRLVSAFVIGAIFGLGIAISGMINPAKVVNFFDVFGAWDPSLAFVMVGALAVAIPGYRLVLSRRKPIMANGFQLPETRTVDRRLVFGSATFGIGWGIAGFCPGGALPALGMGEPSVYLFVASLIAGLALARLIQTRGLPVARRPA